MQKLLIGVGLGGALILLLDPDWRLLNAALRKRSIAYRLSQYGGTIEPESDGFYFSEVHAEIPPALRVVRKHGGRVANSRFLGPNR